MVLFIIGDATNSHQQLLGLNNLLTHICSKEYFTFTSVIKMISTACRIAFNGVVNDCTNSYP